MKKIALAIIFGLFTNFLYSEKLLIYMDNAQTDHLHAYGLTYWCLQQGLKAEWLLNYRCGSFIVDDIPAVREEAGIRGVAYTPVSTSELQSIYQEIEQNNMNRIFLDKAPKIAIYAPPSNEPWDDAVTLVLTYAKIPYDVLWDEEVITGKLEGYDWLHVHHEDFTGQYGKFFASYRNNEWYLRMVAECQNMAYKLGYRTVPEEKKVIAQIIQGYVSQGGFLFAMCSACDTLDIALASEGVDIVPPEIDGTPITENAQEKLDFSKTFSFTGFQLEFNPYVYEFSDIDIDIMKENLYNNPDTFTLFDFSAKEDPIPSMLVQNHTAVIKGFLGQTTAFHRNVIKDSVTILAETLNTDRVKYIHGDFGEGTFTFLGGHDPEDYQHLVGDPPTDLALHKNSPGYRLILNNVLFPAARKRERKT